VAAALALATSHKQPVEAARVPAQAAKLAAAPLLAVQEVLFYQGLAELR
jgi:hypothetical protein